MGTLGVVVPGGAGGRDGVIEKLARKAGRYGSEIDDRRKMPAATSDPGRFAQVQVCLRESEAKTAKAAEYEHAARSYVAVVGLMQNATGLLKNFLNQARTFAGAGDQTNFDDIARCAERTSTAFLAVVNSCTGMSRTIAPFGCATPVNYEHNDATGESSIFGVPLNTMAEAPAKNLTDFAGALAGAIVSAPALEDGGQRMGICLPVFLGAGVINVTAANAVPVFLDAAGGQPALDSDAGIVGNDVLSLLAHVSSLCRTGAAAPQVGKAAVAKKVEKTVHALQRLVDNQTAYVPRLAVEGAELSSKGKQLEAEAVATQAEISKTLTRDEHEQLVHQMAVAKAEQEAMGVLNMIATQARQLVKTCGEWLHL
ncbi:MAG: hypothetical protein LBJ38_01765 [Oscillospiraceae bacterium]|jgi:hypothetical protein|nr:hypothetical protein [Oscillospiraceae bacterium]